MVEVDVVAVVDRAGGRRTLLERQRIVAARAAVDRARRRKADRDRTDAEIDGQARAASRVDRRISGCDEPVGTVRAHRHAAVHGTGVRERVAACRSTQRDTAGDRAGVVDVDLAAAIRGDHARIGAQQGRADDARRRHRAGIRDAGRAARAVLHGQRHPGQADRQAGGARHDAVVGHGLRTGRRIAHHHARRQHAQARSEQRRIDPAVVGQRVVAAGQRHRVTADAQENTDAPARIDRHVEVVGAIRIAGRQRIRGARTCHVGARRGTGRVRGNDARASQREEHACRQQKSRKRFTGLF
ncbi:hypothetical protein P355_4602 [Burkholderia cenocepacia KC-01]|nr:hypothetical protein P355_4602 [Burkholderia cenocepacia KC-01]